MQLLKTILMWGNICSNWIFPDKKSLQIQYFLTAPRFSLSTILNAPLIIRVMQGGYRISAEFPNKKARIDEKMRAARLLIFPLRRDK